MNSRERVLATLDHKEPDRVPIGEWGIDHDTVEKVIGHETYWRARAKTTLALWAGKRDEVVESCKKDLVELIEKLDQDLVPVHLVPPKNTTSKEVRQIDGETWEDEQGYIYKYTLSNDAILCINGPSQKIFQSKEEVVRYFETEYVPSSGFILREKDKDGYKFELEDESHLELVRYVVEKLGGKKFIFARDFTEFELPIGRGQEDFFMAIAMYPDVVKELFDLVTDLNIAKAKIFIDEGVDAIMPGGDFSSSCGPMVSPGVIRNIFLPGMKKLADYVHKKGVRVMSHNCGNNWEIMDILIEAEYECYQSIQSKTGDMDLKLLKEKYGDKITLWGGINIETLHDGTPDENTQDVLYALKYAAHGGGFILGTSNSVAFGSRFENYLAALETARKYGNYPLLLNLEM